MLDRFALVLLRHGVYTHSDTRRAILALRILAEGWSLTQLDQVCRALARGRGPLSEPQAIVLGLRRRFGDGRMGVVPPAYILRHPPLQHRRLPAP